MGGFYEDRRSVWVDVVNGKLRRREGDEVKESDGFVGVITGIRLKRSQYQNQPPVGVLEIAMVNPDDGSKTEYIISGTVLLADGSATTYGRMIVTRLVKPGNVGRGEVIDISVWTPEAGSKVTCATIRPAGVKQTLKPIEHDKDDPKFGHKIVQWIEELIHEHGSFGRSDSPDMSDDDTPEPIESVPRQSSSEPPPPDDYDTPLSRGIAQKREEATSGSPPDDLPF